MKRYSENEMRQLSYDFSQRVAMLMQDELNALRDKKECFDYHEYVMKLVSQGLRRCLILAEDYLTKDMTEKERNAYIDNLTVLINKDIKKGIVSTEFNVKRR